MSTRALSDTGTAVAHRPVAPATVTAWHAPSCFAAAMGSDDDRPPVAESPARIRRSDFPGYPAYPATESAEAEDDSQAR